MILQNTGVTITPKTSCNVPQYLNIHAHVKLHNIEKVHTEMNIEKIQHMYNKYLTKKQGKIEILYILTSKVTKKIVAELKYLQISDINNHTFMIKF
jgi:hypothetical protein